MKALKSTALILTGVFLSFSTFAAELKTADQVIAKYDQARGFDKLKSVQTMRSVASLRMNGMDIPMIIEFKRPKKARMDMTMQGMTISQVINGDKGWKIIPMLGKSDAQPMSNEELNVLADMTDIDGVLADYKSKGHKLDLQGIVDVEGTPAYKLKLTRKNGDVEYNYIDTEYFLMIRAERKMKLNGIDVDTVSINGDFKDVQGMMVPHSMIQTMKMPMGEIKQVMTINEIEINKPIAAARFEMPAPAKPATATPEAK